MEFGEAVRVRRQTRGLTLGDLADQAGLSKAMLSEIETLKKNPTLRIACQIATALDCQISDLLDVPAAEETFQPLDARSRRELVDSSSGVARMLLAPPMVKHGVQVLMFVFPKGSSADFCADARGVIEHVTCLEGRIRVRVGDQTVELGRLESLNFTPFAEHEFTNLASGESRMLLVVDSSHKAVAPIAHQPSRAE